MLYNGFVISLFPIARTLHLPTCNVMNIALVQMAWFAHYSQQEMIQWLWAMGWWVRY